MSLREASHPSLARPRTSLALRPSRASPHRQTALQMIRRTSTGRARSQRPRLRAAATAPPCGPCPCAVRSPAVCSKASPRAGFPTGTWSARKSESAAAIPAARVRPKSYGSDFIRAPRALDPHARLQTARRSGKPRVQPGQSLRASLRPGHRRVRCPACPSSASCSTRKSTLRSWRRSVRTEPAWDRSTRCS